MGGSPSAPAAQPVPPAPEPIDYEKMYSAATKAAREQLIDQEAAIRRLYPDMIGLQLGTARQIAGELDNQYLGRARDVIGSELSAASTPSALEQSITRTATNQLAQGPVALDRKILSAGESAMSTQAPLVMAPSLQKVENVSATTVNPGQLGDSLMSQAASRLNLQGRLSPEAERLAVQQARAGASARGMGVGNAALAAEILNREQFSRQRMKEDTDFAAGIQKMDLDRQIANQDANLRAAISNQGTATQISLGTGQLSLGGQQSNQDAQMRQLAGNRAFMVDARDAYNMAEDRRLQLGASANQLDQARRARLLGLAGDYATLDPYARGLNPAFNLGTATMGTGTGMIGQTFGNAVQAAGNVESFNKNMAMSDRASARNYNAAIQAASMQAGAAGQAGMMGMVGGIGGGALMGAGLAI